MAELKDKKMVPTVKSEIAKREEEILKFWRENKIFEKSLAKPAPRGEFVFYEGPPTANGRPGLHHLEARAFKDLIPRFKTMQGYHVRRRAGWDTHGLPVELEVEKTLGLKSKKDIEKYGLAAFNQKCRESVGQYLEEWRKFTERIGFWLDQDHPYFTYQPAYMESVWWVIKQAAERGLLYKDYKVVPWCPRCGTALSSHELAQGYQEVTAPAVTVKFKIKNPEKHNLPANTFLLVWTTTPWTLPGNVALAVGEGIEYGLAEKDGEYLIMAGRGEKQIAASQLIGLDYEPLFDIPALKNDKSHRVYPADFVSVTEGTGIVHTAVMYGQDDFVLGTKLGLPKHHLVGEDGRFIAGTPWAGQFVKDADKKIITDLEKRGRLFKQETITHPYPFCWRCQTPLIYYARDSWYFKMSSLRDKLLAENQKINWLPEHIKAGRFGEWLAEVKDWAISRERYWGTPLPIWQTADSRKTVVVGSLEELKKYTKKSGNRYFVMRHGEAENNVLNVLSSRADNPHHLTERGRAETEQAAGRLRSAEVNLIVSSDFIRTRETAEIIVRLLGLPAGSVIYDERLREVNHGELNNQPVNVYRNYFKTAEQYFINRLPGGESFTEVKRRLGSALYDLETKYRGQKILIITHESPSWLLFAAAAGTGLAETIARRGTDPDFLKNAEWRELDFTPLPHNQDYELDLHRPFIDEIELVAEDGAVLRRAPEVLDVWLDSGAMPWAQDHYPFSGEGILYPADYIAEAIDQTRGWFYTLLAVSAILAPRLPAGRQGAPYRNVICLGHILDAAGKKMSKSIGNVVDPWLMMERYGADALRFWMYSVNQPGDGKNFDEAGVNEIVKKVINPLLNVVSFYELYPVRNEASNGVYGRRGQAVVSPPVVRPVLDEWLLALLDRLIGEVTAELDHYRVTEAARALRDFIADLSQWYVRRSRDRFRRGDSAEQAQAAAALGSALRQLAKLLAPFMPFLAEEIYQKLRQPVDPGSVHLADWPEVKSKAKDQRSKLLVEMGEVRKIASLGLEARARAGIKVRQPLSELAVAGHHRLSPALTDLIKDEVNVQTVVWREDLPASVVLDTSLTPELKRAGEFRDLVRQIQDLRKQNGFRPGEPAVLQVVAGHPARLLIEQEAENLKKSANLKKIEFGPSADVPFFLSH
ncbi:MAG: class I tRNA ligase family protein [Candidatus Vogelbacteria bacterium]|nr:class I tRNA ligase family protein [Candidatus Vogelbacteria bacterium]